jgi:cell division protein FtsI (penicillin-binding protein 3)
MRSLPLLVLVAVGCRREPPSAVSSPPEAPSVIAIAQGVAAIGGDERSLTIDRRLQAEVDAEVSRLSPDANAVAIVAIEPSTGAIRAIAGARENTIADLAARAAWVPGSVSKVFSIAAAIDAGVIAEDDILEGGVFSHGGASFEDATLHGPMSVADVMAWSSNVGAARIALRLGKERIAAAYAAFGFGAKPAVELPEVAAGTLAIDDEATSARVASGGGFTASPLQLAAAFAVVAFDGRYRAPTLTGRAVAPRPVIRPETAAKVRGLLEQVVTREDGTGTGARVAGVRIFGKTGTATLGDHDRGARWASFVGGWPAEAPAFVLYVGVETTARGYSGGTIAAPAFARIVRAVTTRDTGT